MESGSYVRGLGPAEESGAVLDEEDGFEEEGASRH